MSAKSVAASPKLYLVVPAFNEEQVLLESLCVLESKLTQMIQSNAIAKESALVLVDDGSSDRTWEIAKAHFDERYMRDPALNPPIKSNQPQFLAIKLARNFVVIKVRFWLGYITHLASVIVPLVLIVICSKMKRSL